MEARRILDQPDECYEKLLNASNVKSKKTCKSDKTSNMADSQHLRYRTEKRKWFTAYSLKIKDVKTVVYQNR